MSTSVKLSIGTLAIVAGLAACGRSKTASNNDDFSRDLQMASSSVDLQAPAVNPSNLSSLETQPSSAPDKSTVVKKSSTGTKAVRSQSPTVHAAPTAEVASTDETQLSQTTDVAPTPEPTSEPVAQAPQPTTVAVDDNGGGDGDYGTSGNGGGILGPGNGPVGTVIRGGGVGDGDNCEHDGGVIYGGGYPRTGRRPVYIPNPGGVGTSRMPTGTSGRAPSGGRFPGSTGTRRRGQ